MTTKKKAKPKSNIPVLPKVDHIKVNLKARKMLKPYDKSVLRRFEDLQRFREFGNYLIVGGYVGINNAECQVIPELFPWDLFEKGATHTSVSFATNHALPYDAVEKEYIQFKYRSADVTFVCKMSLDSIGAIGKFLRISKYKRTYKEFLASIQTRVIATESIIESQTRSVSNSKITLSKYTKLLANAQKKGT